MVKKIGYLAVFGFLFAQSIAYADMIRGEIVGFNTERWIITVRPTDDFGSEDYIVKIVPATRIINALTVGKGGLKVGQAVEVDAYEDRTLGYHVASSVEVVAA